MGYPSENFESYYRNDINEVRRFFNKRHANKFKIYNLCIEENRQYSKDIFEKGEVSDQF